MRVGLVQMCAGDVPADNLITATAAIEHAAADGASLILTPEVTNCLSMSRARQTEVLHPESSDPVIAGLRDTAARLGVAVLIGSVAVKTEETRFANRSVLIGPGGEVIARYDKIHMFDVTLGSGEVYAESDGYRPGTRAVTARVGAARLGLTICYDLRFPHLYRDLAQAGAQILTVPSAFTRPTGAAHWEVLLRARAIETGCYVLAPAQTGGHPTSQGRPRETWGHSLVIDPWGKVVLNMGETPGVACVDLDLDAVAQARQRIPALSHDRDYNPPDPI